MRVCEKHERLNIYLIHVTLYIYNLTRLVYYCLLHLTTFGLIDSGFSLNNVYEYKIYNVRQEYVYQTINVKSRDLNTYLVKTRWCNMKTSSFTKKNNDKSLQQQPDIDEKNKEVACWRLKSNISFHCLAPTHFFFWYQNRPLLSSINQCLRNF